MFFYERNNKTGFARVGFSVLEFPTLSLKDLGKGGPWLFRVKRVKITSYTSAELYTLSFQQSLIAYIISARPGSWETKG